MNIIVIDSEDDYELYKAEWDLFSKACQRDFRNLGLILLQMCLRRLLTPDEYRRYSRIDAFTTRDLTDILYIHRFPESLRRIFETCFGETEPDDFKIGRKIGKRVVNAFTSYGRAIRKVSMKMKDEVQLLFHDFPQESKKPFWTEEDELMRKRYVIFDEEKFQVSCVVTLAWVIIVIIF